MFWLDLPAHVSFWAHWFGDSVCNEVIDTAGQSVVVTVTLFRDNFYGYSVKDQNSPRTLIASMNLVAFTGLTI